MFYAWRKCRVVRMTFGTTASHQEHRKAGSKVTGTSARATLVNISCHLLWSVCYSGITPRGSTIGHISGCHEFVSSYS